jgi:mono/diheme cytochrome c family protein
MSNKQIYSFSLLGLLMGFYLLSCADNNIYKQGKKLYLQHCENCHMENGEGLGELYPPLNRSDYLVHNREDLPCIIRNGLKGEIIVNSLTYDLEMPGISHLSDTEINNLLNYIFSAWDNNLPPSRIKDVQNRLSSCPVLYGQ